jgi:hypothetical protein
MGRSHPIALRERVVTFVEEGHGHREAARHFRVSPRFVNDLVILKRETGSFLPRRQEHLGGGKLSPRVGRRAAGREWRTDAGRDAALVFLLADHSDCNVSKTVNIRFDIGCTLISRVIWHLGNRFDSKTCIQERHTAGFADPLHSIDPWNSGLSAGWILQTKMSDFEPSALWRPLEQGPTTERLKCERETVDTHSSK